MALSSRARKRIVLLLVAVVVIGAGLAVALQWRRASIVQESAEARERGLELHRQGDWEPAMRSLSRATRHHRDDPEVMVALAESRLNVPLESGRHISNAISFAQQALVVDPDNPEALALLVNLYEQTGQVTELIGASERLLASDPDNQDALRARASGLIVLGRSSASEAIDDLVEAYPDDVRGHALRLQNMLSSGAGADAVRTYADAEARKRPTSAEFLLLQAEARVRTSAPGDTLDDLRLSEERAEALEIEDPASLAKVVQLLDLLGQSEVADGLLGRELNADSSGETVAIAVERDWKAGRVEQARDRAETAVENSDQPASALLGWTVLLAGDGEGAGLDHPAYERLRLRDGAEARFWSHLIDGREALRRGEWGAARSSLTTAMQSPAARTGGLAPLDIAEYLLGRAELALGAWREASARWERVASRNPSWVSVRLDLADLTLENGLARESFDHAGRVLAREPGNYAAGKAAARAMVALLEAGTVDLEQSDETVSLVQELRQAVGDQSEAELAQVLALDARVRLMRGEVDLAQRAVDQLAGLSVTPPQRDLLPLLDRAEAAGLSGLDRLGQGAGDASTAAALLARDARQLRALGRNDEARRLFTEAMANASAADTAAYERQYALWLESAGEPDGLELLQELAEQNPRSAQAQVDLLNSPSAWLESGVAAPAIQRLREIGGESSVAWRIYEARSLLTFEPSEARAAQAVELLGPGLRASSPDAAALALAGEAMAALGDAAAASDYFGRALDADPRRVTLYPRLIGMLLGDGRLDLARARQMEFVRQSGVEGASLRRRAELSEALGMWDRAVADRRTLVESAGATALDRARLGAALARGGSVEEADALFERMLREPLQDAQALALSADFLTARGRADEALAAIERAEINDSLRDRLASALLAEQGRLSEAIIRLEGAVEREASAELYADLARLRLRADDAAGAVEAIDAGLALSPDSADLRALSASARMQSGETPASDALAQLSQAAAQGEMAPGMAEIIEATRRVTEDNDLNAYIRSLEGIGSRNPPSLLLSRLLSNAYLQAGQTEKAVTTASDAARVFSASPESAKLAAEILTQTGRLTEAEAMAQRWFEQTSSRPNDQYDARVALAQLAVAQGEPAQAARALDPVRSRLIEEAERAPDRFDLYARSLAGAGRADDARALFDGRLDDGDALWFRLYTSAAVALYRTPETARAWLEEAGSVARAHPALVASAGQAWFDLAGLTGEAADFERVVALLEPLNKVEQTPLVALLAVSLDQAGRYEEAEARFRQALEIDVLAQEPVILNNFAYLLVKRGSADEEAVALAQRAATLARERGFPPEQIAGFLHTKGSALIAVGRSEEGEAAYREALSADPDHPETLLDLSELLFEGGEVAEAVRVFGRIPDPGGSNDAEFVERYESLKARLTRADP